MDLISIILPYHNKKFFISKTLKSILVQSYQKFELIIIYDDSDKKDLIYLKRLTKNDSRIKLRINKKNIGAAKSRNKGILKSRGKYICFIDADDIWKINKLKIQLEFMKKNDCYLSHTNYRIINSSDEAIGLMKVKKLLDYNNLIYSCDIGLSTVMIDAKLRSKIVFPNITTKEDFILWLKLSKKYKFFGLQQDLVSWRRNRASSLYISQKIRDAFTLYSKYEKFSLIKSYLFVLMLSLNFIKKSFLQKFYK